MATSLTFLQMVQAALVEAGITQTTTQPQTLDNLTGMAEKMKRWVAQAWDDIRDLESDQAEFCKAWFQVTVNPRFYFDVDGVGNTQVFAGDVLVGSVSGATVNVTAVRIVNNGLWADGSAQGLIDFTDLTGVLMPSEPLTIQSTGETSCRFLSWGDYRLDSATEMGDNGYINNLQDIWWQSLRLSDVAEANPPSTMQRPLPYLAYSQFMQNYDVNVITLGTPRIVTETPDDGTRIMFYPPPDRPYRLVGYYYTTDSGLVNDDDTPQGLKAVYHPMIVWKALMYYGEYEQQSGILAEAQARYTSFKKRLDRETDMPAVFVSKRLY